MDKNYSINEQLFLSQTILLIGFILGISDSVFAMKLERIREFQKELNASVFADNFDVAFDVVKRFNKFLVNEKIDNKEQEVQCDLLFSDLVEKISESKNLSFKVACFILEGAGYSVNDFLKKRKNHLPLFLLNSQVYKHAFKDAENFSRKIGHLRDSFVPFSTMGKFYQITANSVAKLFLKAESNLSTIIAKRYQRASSELFEPDVIESINIFCHNTFLNHFLAESVNNLYKAKNESELVKSLVNLIALANISKGDILALTSTNLDVSKILFFKQYINNFAVLCKKEKALGSDKFLKSSELSSVAKFIDLVAEILSQVADVFEKNGKAQPQNLGHILGFIEVKILNYVFIPIFEQLKNNECLVSIYEILNLAGDIILDSNRFDKYIPSSHLINIKQLVKSNAKWITSKLDSLAIQLLYSYLKIDASLTEIVFLLRRLDKIGFGPQKIMHHFLHAVAILLQENKERSFQEKIVDIMEFINANSITSKYKFDNYEDLIGSYLRTYELIDLIKANANNEGPIALLLNMGVQINILDFDDKSPLAYAIEGDKLKYVQLLVEKGADVNLVVWDGNTPIMLAILKNNIEVIKVLLEHGADPELKNIFDQNALFLSKRSIAIENLLKIAEKKTVMPFKKRLDIFMSLTSSLNSLASKRWESDEKIL